MAQSANVLAIPALHDLRAGLRTFSTDARSALESAQLVIRRTMDYLNDRNDHWHTEVRRLQGAVSQAASALATCQASGFFDPETGRYHAPECSAYETALLRARRSLAEAEAELRNVQHWIRTVEQAATDYHRQVQRLNNNLANTIPQAVALLDRSTTILLAYVGMQPLSSADSSMTPPHGGVPAVANNESQESFREHMAGLTVQQRGAWGERALIDEIRSKGHRILGQHLDTPTSPGYDCASWDSRTLHIWEVKNYSANESSAADVVRELGALDEDGRATRVTHFLRGLPSDDPDRSSITAAIQQDLVQWHVRLGPDTDVSFEPIDQLSWGSVEVRQYAYAEMLRSALSTSNVQTSQSS